MNFDWICAFGFRKWNGRVTILNTDNNIIFSSFCNLLNKNKNSVIFKNKVSERFKDNQIHLLIYLRSEHDSLNSQIPNSHDAEPPKP